MKKLIEYATGRVLAEVKRSKINEWCEAHGYLPHHWTMRGLVVIAK